MVSRVYTNDGTYTFNGNCGLDTQTGVLYRKTQSGGDYSGVKPKRKKHVPRRRFYLNRENNYSVSILSRSSSEYDFINAFTGPPAVVRRGSFHSCAGAFAINTPVSITPNEYNLLLSKLYRKVSNSHFNAGVFLGTGHEALETIASTAFKISKALVAARNLDPAGVAKALGVQKHGRFNNRNHGFTATSILLEYQYGWKPLVSDCFDAATTLSDILALPFRERHVVRMHRDTVYQYDGASARRYESGGNSYRYQIVAYISEPPSVIASLGLTDPLSIAWELMPYSFIADWFLPIGNYLAARSAAQGLVGRFIETESVRKSARGLLATWYDTFISQDSHNSYEFSTIITRNVTSHLEARMPHNFTPLSKAVGWERAVNALALLNNFAGAR